MKIKWLSNGLYSLKNCNKQFGQAFRPPPPFWAMPKFTRFFLGWGFPKVCELIRINYTHHNYNNSHTKHQNQCIHASALCTTNPGCVSARITETIKIPRPRRNMWYWREKSGCCLSHYSTQRSCTVTLLHWGASGNTLLAMLQQYLVLGWKFSVMRD